jgi:hypothetical protein
VQNIDQDWPFTSKSTLMIPNNLSEYGGNLGRMMLDGTVYVVDKIDTFCFVSLLVTKYSD